MASLVLKGVANPAVKRDREVNDEAAETATEAKNAKLDTVMPYLTDSHRIQYLVGRLTGNALKIIAGVIPSGENYKSIWDSLTKKYQDKRALGYANFTISAKNNKQTFNLTALVIDCITDRLPIDYIDTSIVRHLVNIPLADPFWHIPGEIEIVLGAKLFPFLLLSGKVIAPPAPPAIETVFGFVFMGDAAANTASSVIGDITAIPSSSSASFLTCFEKSIDASLSKFWELEEVPVNKFLSRTDEECEQIYSSTVSRDSSGRYCTVLPFAKDPSSLGNSYTVAHRRLLALERRLSDTDLRVSYNAAIMDYINNKYLDPVLPSDESDGGYIIPHHPVVRLDKQTTKVRVVLDASAQCHNGVSLNDILHTGPNLLANLKIPRHLAVAQGSRVNIVAFADASMKAYGCVVFLHVTDPTGNICVRLVCAKSKVAPVKVVSLARLELCAAVIMSKLTKLVYDTYSARTPIDNVYAFSDSKIALSWIHSSPHRWNIFVSNRVAKCHENLEPKNFFHVAGVQNPADCLSRGLLPEQLLTHKLWWNGPEWLITPVPQWPIESFQPEKCEDLPEFNSKTLVATASRGVELSPLYYNDLLSSELVNRRIEWHMSPPRAPHFGGIWESNIKSLKTHLYRIIGNQLLTYEELLTVLTQIETIMNSRPLCVLQEEPHLEPLTPAHFIMASPLQYLPLAPVSSTPLVTRKSLLDQMIRSYWKRWHLEYLNNLQVRQKWLKDVTNVKIGTVVLIHEDNVPPLRWPLGIIEKTYPGADGTVRVALVKTQNGFLKRPIVKLSPLPSQ
nr:unnamed protein product [Amyelois transitella]